MNMTRRILEEDGMVDYIEDDDKSHYSQWKMISPILCPLCNEPLCSKFGVYCKKVCVHEGKYKNDCLQSVTSGVCKCGSSLVLETLLKEYNLLTTPGIDIHPHWNDYSVDYKVLRVMEYLTYNKLDPILQGDLFEI